ncbi:exodeoxyribonuclease VII small subunit [Anaerococcus sp. Marseille-P9784]|uniref:exodeoxyribonuclease VII small subunit n=1 Tax=Anaerococcus sp. Marseille-P9784 TaxID=2614127 RepID=UPI00124A0BD3|nr:exodeoxyribonuclease VII small subunit [Anaerococcus sp. Marseille-P9784]
MDKSFDDKYKQMQDLLTKLENNEDNLEESIKIYQKAQDLYKELSEQLDDYKAKIEVIDIDE